MDDTLTSEQIDKHATRSLVHGILAFMFPIVVFSVLAMKHARRVPLEHRQRGMATAGKILGIIGYVLSGISVLYVLLLIGLAALVFSSS